MAFLAIGIAIAAITPYATFNPDNFNNAASRFADGSVVVDDFIEFFP